MRAIAIGLSMVACSCVADVARAGDKTPTAQEEQRLRDLGDRLPDGKLLWVRGDKIFYSPVQPFNEQQITASGVGESNPRWSPDGTRILFVREPAGVWVMDADFTNAERVIDYGDTASWTRDGSAITAVNAQDRHEVLRYEFGSGNTTVIYDSEDPDFGGHDQSGDELSQAAELRNGGRFILTFTLDRGHHTYIVDLQAENYLDNAQMDRGDCSPSWAPDGSYTTTTARTSNRPALKTVFHAGGPSVDDSQHFIGIGDVCGCSYYVHGHRVSSDGQWVVMGGLDRDENNREIYIWKIGDPESENARVTFDSAEDKSPDLHVGGGVVDCTDGDGDGYGQGPDCTGPDCDDSNASVHPGAIEACNGVDDDCADGVPANEQDGDSDGYRGCDGDCDDGDASIHPGANEACNGVDDDCADGVPANEQDGDSDGHRGCEGDCDDGDPSVNPGATEACNGVDDDCDGDTDEDCPCTNGETQSCGTDEGECVAGTQTCSAGQWGGCEGEVGPGAEACNGLDDDCDGEVPANEADADEDGSRLCDGDCDDGDADVNPGATEACNGVDDDCDDEVPADERDEDHDGHRICAGDCDDADAAVNPAATEECNEKDDNCDSNTDEGCPCSAGDTRPCGEDQGACEAGTQSCDGGTWGECTGAVGPVEEVCEDGVDNDCDGETDEGCGGDDGGDPGGDQEIVVVGACGCGAGASGGWGVMAVIVGVLFVRRRGNQPG